MELDGALGAGATLALDRAAGSFAPFWWVGTDDEGAALGIDSCATAGAADAGMGGALSA